MTWLAGFEQKAASTPGGTFDGSPFRLVLHTTEGGSIEGAIGAYAVTGSWPHFTADPVQQRKIQHYPLSTSARALAHPKGSPETNRAGAIQVEIVGYAKDSHNWPAVVLEWLGREVVEPIHNSLDFKLTHPPFVGVEHGTIATVNAAQRFTWAEWRDFNGVCGHQHVPGNDHWDPGRLDVAHIVAAVNQPAPVPIEEDKVLHLVQGDKKPDWFVTDDITKRYVGSADEAARIVYRTVKAGGKIEHNGNNGPVIWPQADVDAIKG